MSSPTPAVLIAAARAAAQAASAVAQAQIPATSSPVAKPVGLKWYVNPKFDAPELNSPKPCSHGAGCNYQIKNKAGEMVSGCCAFVHPGEEGSGRHLFPARTYVDRTTGQTIHQKACVRLTGKALFYDRRGLRLPWGEYCAKHGIPYSPNPPVTVATGKRREVIDLASSTEAAPVAPAPTAEPATATV